MKSFNEEETIRKILDVTTKLDRLSNKDAVDNFKKIVADFAYFFGLSNIIFIKCVSRQSDERWYESHISPDGTVLSLCSGQIYDATFEIFEEIPGIKEHHFLFVEVVRDGRTLGRIILNFNHPISAFYESIHEVFFTMGAEILSYL